MDILQAVFFAIGPTVIEFARFCIRRLKHKSTLQACNTRKEQASLIRK